MSPARYSLSAMALHWAIALALAFQLALGWGLEDIPKGPGLYWSYQLHKSVGISILVLSAARLAIRLLHPRPAPPIDSLWAQRLAKGVHAALYAVMIGGPVTGWMLVSTAKIKVPTLVFGVVPWPHLPIPLSWHEVAVSAHGLLALLGVGLFLLHVAGALRHQFFEDGSFLGRMIPFGAADGARGRKASVAPVAGSLGLVALAFLGGQIINPPTAPAATVGLPATESGPVSGPTEDAQQVAVATDDAASTGASVDTAAVEQPLSDWKVAPGGRLGFTAQWQGTPVNGSFSRWTSVIRFSPDALDQSSIRVTIDLASATTGDSQRDEMLVGDTFFDTAVHPKATFTSSNFKHLGGDKYQAQGMLNMRGQNRPVALTFTLRIIAATASVRGSANLNRIDFGVGQGEFAATDQIAATVGVNFNFTAKMLPPR